MGEAAASPRWVQGIDEPCVKHGMPSSWGAEFSLPKSCVADGVRTKSLSPRGNFGVAAGVVVGGRRV